MNNSSLSAASMRLFNSVVSTRKSPSPENFEVLKDYGLVLSASALPLRDEILEYLRTDRVSTRQMNQTFYSCPAEVESKSFEERLSDQLTHYFSTYGLRALGIDSSFMYVPNDWEKINVPEQLTFRVVNGVSPKVLIAACLKMLKSGIALKQATIEDILVVLKGCGYEFTGDEVVANKEARILICGATGILPKDGEELFRYLVFKATGLSLLVKDKKTFDAIKASNYVIPNLSDGQLIELSKSFNRRKEYWMAFKVANRVGNASVVNKITKLSKSNHKPLKVDILSNLTNLREVNVKDLNSAIKAASLFKLVRAANALKLYEAPSKRKYYVVRNGRSFVKGSDKTYSNRKVLDKLIKEIRKRIDTTKKVYIPEGLQYVIPTSEKQFTGEVPNFSTVEVDYTDRDVLVGVYWENGSHHHVDYDLSMNSLGGGRIGWNRSWCDSDITFSGDLTNAPDGAAEWLVVKKIDTAWGIVNNLYSAYGGEGVPEFTVMVGYGRKEKSSNYCNYFIDPNDLLFSAKITPDRKQTTVGVISPSGEGKMRFILVNTSNGNKNVSDGSGTVSLLEALLPRAENTLKLNDFVNLCSDPSEADLDLSPNKLSKDTLLSLFS
jgi:hypothetical protein